MLACVVQLPDLPLSSLYGDHLLNSVLLLLHVSLPSSAKLGVGLAPCPKGDVVLSLPAIRCTAEEVLRRFEALFGALNNLLVAPVFAKPGTVATVGVAALMRLLANVCHTVAVVPGVCCAYHPQPPPLLSAAVVSTSVRDRRVQVSSLRAPSTLDGKAHFGVDAVSREETLSVIGYAQLLAPLKSLAIQLLGSLLPVLGTHVFAFRRDVATCVIENLNFAWYAQ